MKLLSRVFNKNNQNKLVDVQKKSSNVNVSIDEAILLMARLVCNVKDQLIYTEGETKTDKTDNNSAKDENVRSSVISVHAVHISQRKKDQFKFKLMESQKTMTPLLSLKCSREELYTMLKHLEFADLSINCNRGAMVELYKTLPKEWFGKQRNVSIKINENGNVSKDAEFAFLMTIFKIYHSIRDVEARRGEPGNTYSCSEFIQTHQNQLRLTKLPSKHFIHRTLNVKCPGMVITEGMAMRAVLSYTHENGTLTFNSLRYWDAMKKIVSTEADRFVEQDDGTMYYYLNGKKGTITKGPKPVPV